MIHLVVLAHAPLASSLARVAAHAFPDCAATLRSLDVLPSDSPEEIEARLRDEVGDGQALLLCDVFGATPCNAALRMADGARVRVVSGVNVPMLWRVLCYANEPLDRLVSRAVDGAVQGVMQVSTVRPQNQSVQAGPNDQVQHHHQQ
ncbi:MAG: PTS sugar transporter subunit IIA [Rubrivivax sp.]|jgi:PTS system mannose-specific IIA component